MLNIKQEKFIVNIAKGMSQREAYKDAYNAKYKDEAIDSKASTLFNSDKVQERYRELRDKALEKDIMTAIERMKFLSDVANGIIKEKEPVFHDGDVTIADVETSINNKIKAIDTLNKMTGEYTQNINLGNSKLEVSINVIE